MHGRQVVLINPSHVDPGLLSSWNGVIGAEDIVHPGFSGEWSHAGEGSRFNSRQLAEACKHAICSASRIAWPLEPALSYVGVNRSTCAMVMWLESKPRLCRISLEKLLMARDVIMSRTTVQATCPPTMMLRVRVPPRVLTVRAELPCIAACG